MKTVTYKTKVIGEGNHASLSIPNIVLEKLGANRRAPLKITVNGLATEVQLPGLPVNAESFFLSENVNRQTLKTVIPSQSLWSLSLDIEKLTCRPN